jgi:hypothetical protein
MTPFPADILVVPGIGQIVNNLPIIVPLHNSHDQTTLSKKTDFEISEKEQLGGGNDDQEDKIENNESETNVEFNEKKRKSMDESDYQSFMHPKMFKTSSIDLKKTPETSTKRSKTESETNSNIAKQIGKQKQSKLNHKFNVY